MSLYITIYIYICRGVYMYTRKSLVLIYGIRNPPIILRMLGKAMMCIYIAIGNRLMITAAKLKDIECLEKVGLQWKATELIRSMILRIHSEERLQIAGPLWLNRYTLFRKVASENLSGNNLKPYHDFHKTVLFDNIDNSYLPKNCGALESGISHERSITNKHVLSRGNWTVGCMNVYVCSLECMFECMHLCTRVRTYYVCIHALMQDKHYLLCAAPKRSISREAYKSLQLVLPNLNPRR